MRTGGCPGIGWAACERPSNGSAMLRMRTPVDAWHAVPLQKDNSNTRALNKLFKTSVSLPEWLSGVDLRSTGGNSAWVRAPQMTMQVRRKGELSAHRFYKWRTP